VATLPSETAELLSNPIWLRNRTGSGHARPERSAEKTPCRAALAKASLSMRQLAYARLPASLRLQLRRVHRWRVFWNRLHQLADGVL